MERLSQKNEAERGKRGRGQVPGTVALSECDFILDFAK
jgi:hypothetical protein